MSTPVQVADKRNGVTIIGFDQKQTVTRVPLLEVA